ncbi:class I SAM-dependent methyltransferase [Halobacillus mangrovi]|uniref:class I SAM-dependent methyltransferase n=1 Tax=Halobacillus mangrovi TaxID=402384 RepID=UPI003D999E84
MNIDQQKKIFDKQAKKYSKRARKKTPDHRWRQKLLKSASGKILEVSAGAGANFQYYPKDASILAVDLSSAMLQHAEEVAKETDSRVDFLVANVEELDLPANSFDTVVSTLSMCAYPNPERVLRQLATWCKDDGQVLLMEHGVSSNRIFSKLQHVFDPLFKKRVGCHINRDIVKLIESSPLEIVRIENALFDAVHLVWAKPNPTQIK